MKGVDYNGSSKQLSFGALNSVSASDSPTQLSSALNIRSSVSPDPRAVFFTSINDTTNSYLTSISGEVDGVSSSGIAISALRQAYAAQKYKEIQLANDVDFASQIEAHFGVKPKHADDTSYFIGGSSSMIDINPIVNTNLSVMEL